MKNSFFGILVLISGLHFSALAQRDSRNQIKPEATQMAPISPKAIAYTGLCYAIAKEGHGLPQLAARLKNSPPQQRTKIITDYGMAYAKANIRGQLEKIAFHAAMEFVPVLAELHRAKLAFEVIQEAKTLLTCRAVSNLMAQEGTKWSNLSDPKQCPEMTANIERIRGVHQAQNLVAIYYQWRISGLLTSNCQALSSTLLLFSGRK